MATFRRSQIGELTGSTGSLTFSKNKSGGIVKFKSTNKNRNTVKQAQNRNSFTQSNGGWHTLTDEQKNEFNNYAKSLNLTGLNVYLQLQKNISEYSKLLKRGNVFVFYIGGINWSNTVPDPITFTKSIPNPLSNFRVFADRITLTGVSKPYQIATSIYFDFDYFFHGIPDSNVTTTERRTGDWMRNNLNIPLQFMFYYRLNKAQKSEYNNTNFSPWFMVRSQRRTINITTNMTTFTIRTSISNWNNLLSLIPGSPSDFEYEVRLINETGEQQKIGSNFIL